jgi:hypothetical protein
MDVTYTRLAATVNLFADKANRFEMMVSNGRLVRVPDKFFEQHDALFNARKETNAMLFDYFKSRFGEESAHVFPSVLGSQPLDGYKLFKTIEAHRNIQRFRETSRLTPRRLHVGRTKPTESDSTEGLLCRRRGTDLDRRSIADAATPSGSWSHENDFSTDVETPPARHASDSGLARATRGVLPFGSVARRVDLEASKQSCTTGVETKQDPASNLEELEEILRMLESGQASTAKTRAPIDSATSPLRRTDKTVKAATNRTVLTHGPENLPGEHSQNNIRRSDPRASSLHLSLDREEAVRSDVPVATRRSRPKSQKAPPSPRVDRKHPRGSYVAPTSDALPSKLVGFSNPSPTRKAEPSVECLAAIAAKYEPDGFDQGDAQWFLYRFAPTAWAGPDSRALKRRLVEKFGMFLEAKRFLLERCPNLVHNPDLNATLVDALTPKIQTSGFRAERFAKALSTGVESGVDKREVAAAAAALIALWSERI